MTRPRIVRSLALRAATSVVASALAACSGAGNNGGNDGASPDAALADLVDSALADLVDSARPDALDVADVVTPADAAEANVADGAADGAADAVDAAEAGCEGGVCGGACVDLQTDARHCGACATDCTALPGVNAASVRCVAGVCDVTGACVAGRAHCAADPSSGCEADLSTPAHCGSCTNVCPSPTGGTATCTAGACGVDCAAGSHSCAGACLSNNSVLSCGTACAPCPTGPNAMPTCDGTSCGLQCATGFADCDGDLRNGCEVNLGTDPNHCGACPTRCSVNNGVGACVSGRCVVGACNAGFDDCANGVADGCETNVASDPNHCGGCATRCAVPNGTAGCAAGRCTIASCNSGFSDCLNGASDGCETNTSNDPLNCGGCRRQCSVPNGTAGCALGNCTVVSCNRGFDDCLNGASDGCETNLLTSTANCGACGNNCNTACVGNVSGTTCGGGTCAVTVCASGTFNADGVCANGCECRATGTSTSCTTPTSLGALMVGTGTSYTGNLVPLGQEAYLSVTFAGNTSPLYHPHIRMTAGNADFAFDVLANCVGGAIACGTEGGNSVNRQDWETSYTSGDATDVRNFQPIPAVGAAGTVVIHVYRKPGRPLSCASYTLAITN